MEDHRQKQKMDNRFFKRYDPYRMDTRSLESFVSVIDNGSIAEAARRLPEEFRVPVVLCDVADLSYAQIAASTGVPIGTVRSRIIAGDA